MRQESQQAKPAWSLLYLIVLIQSGLIAVVETSVPPGALRTILESSVVVAAFGLMLLWRRLNRARFDLEGRKAEKRG